MTMIRRLLVLLDQGSMSFSELAEELGLTQVDLKGRMELMVRMGHLEAIDLRGHHEDGGGGCPGCVLSGRCRDKTCDDGTPMVGYRLTEKGMRLARKDAPIINGEGSAMEAKR